MDYGKFKYEKGKKEKEAKKKSAAKANQKGRRRYHVSILISRVLPFLDFTGRER